MERERKLFQLTKERNEFQSLLRQANEKIKVSWRQLIFSHVTQTLQSETPSSVPTGAPFFNIQTNFRKDTSAPAQPPTPESPPEPKPEPPSSDPENSEAPTNEPQPEVQLPEEIEYKVNQYSLQLETIAKLESELEQLRDLHFTKQKGLQQYISELEQKLKERDELDLTVSNFMGELEEKIKQHEARYVNQQEYVSELEVKVQELETKLEIAAATAAAAAANVTLIAREEQNSEEIAQWAQEVVDFSSQASGDDPSGEWGVNGILGEPKVTEYGDSELTWAPKGKSPN